MKIFLFLYAILEILDAMFSAANITNLLTPIRVMSTMCQIYMYIL